MTTVPGTLSVPGIFVRSFARRFAAWSGGRASVRWVNVQGLEVPKVCGPMGAHGFYRQDGEAVAAINGFIRSR